MPYVAPLTRDGSGERLGQDIFSRRATWFVLARAMRAEGKILSLPRNAGVAVCRDVWSGAASTYTVRMQRNCDVIGKVEVPWPGAEAAELGGVDTAHAIAVRGVYWYLSGAARQTSTRMVGVAYTPRHA